MKKFRITIDGKEYNVEVEEVREGAAPQIQRRVQPSASAPAPAAVAAAPTPKQEGTKAPAGNGGVIAPMPGTILKVLVNKGDKVDFGQTVVILEAMKMENNINANATGIITGIEVSPGQSVDTNQLLLTIE